jgi:hypothetical protein
MDIKKANSSDLNGTCYQGTVHVRYASMVSVFGEPNEGPSADNKVKGGWVLEIDGIFCNIYAWKVGRKLLKNVRSWNVGGHDKQALQRVCGALDVSSIDLYD